MTQILSVYRSHRLPEDTRSHIRLKFLCLCLLILLCACHPPVENYLSQSYQHTISWIGAPVTELVLLKGKPNQIRYLGQTNRSMVESEFWTPELDRFVPMYRQYGPLNRYAIIHQQQQQHYQMMNSEGPWLMTYQSPVRSYRSKQRDCTEYFVIDVHGLVVEAGYTGALVNDYKHCPMPSARPFFIKE